MSHWHGKQGGAAMRIPEVLAADAEVAHFHGLYCPAEGTPGRLAMHAAALLAVAGRGGFLLCSSR